MSLHAIPNTTSHIRRVTVLNWKGGCGKSMLAINLAAYYASQGYKTVLIDHDPQGTALRWLNQRTAGDNAIHGINATNRNSQITRSFLMRLPPGTQRVVIDTPAGTRGHDLQELVHETDRIIVPVLPSDADIHAAAGFIGELLLNARVRNTGAKVGVIANRVKRNTLMYQSLQRFLKQLQFPLLGELRDTQLYVHAAESGLGIFELQPPSRIRRDIKQWQPIIDWLEHDFLHGNQLDFNLG